MSVSRLPERNPLAAVGDAPAATTSRLDAALAALLRPKERAATVAQVTIGGRVNGGAAFDAAMAHVRAQLQAAHDADAVTFLEIAPGGSVRELQARILAALEVAPHSLENVHLNPDDAGADGTRLGGVLWQLMQRGELESTRPLVIAQLDYDPAQITHVRVHDALTCLVREVGRDARGTVAVLHSSRLPLRPVLGIVARAPGSDFVLD